MASEAAQEAASLHGSNAARRQAVTELLFFASVGDLYRCQKICSRWQIEPKDEKCCDYDKRTPLHLAASEGCYSVVEWLIKDCKVPVNPVDRFKRTPLEDAVRADYGEVTTLLLQHSARIFGKDGEFVELAETGLAGNVRIFGELEPEWEIDPHTLRVEEKLGEGEFGIVYKAKWFGSTVAVKVLKDHNAVALGDFRTELNVLQKVHHPNTVQFFGAVTKQTPYMIVTEYMGVGSLADMFKAQGPKSCLPLPRAVQLALDCAKGMAYLHNRQPMVVIHRDLKPANLMLGGLHVRSRTQRDLMYRELATMKIADFGLSKSLKIAAQTGHQLATAEAAASGKLAGRNKGNDDSAHRMEMATYKLTGETGSYRYMAPEVFRHEPYNNKVDVYAFSMICFQLFEGLPPFWELDPVEAARLASYENFRPRWGKTNAAGLKIPEALVELVERCWAPDYDMRPEFEDVCSILKEVLTDLPPTPSMLEHQDKGCCTVQ